MRRHHAAILGLCVSMLRGRSEAEDAAQDIFVKAYRSLDAFQETSSFSTWLYRIASNHCLDILRRKAREKEQSLDAMLDGEKGVSRGLLPAVPDASKALEDAELIERMLGRLAPEYRLIVTLREVQGLSYEELAEALDCSLDAVKARLKRARERLEEIARHFLESGSV